MPQTIDLINFPCGEDVTQWPKLTCTQPGQLDLQDAGLRLPDSQDILFQDNGQLRSFDNNHRLVFDRGGGLLELHEAGAIRFLTGSPTPTEKLRILTTGQVGIGTATPTSLLHVTGDIRADGALRVAGNVAVGGTLTVSSSVGIGTAAPTQMLEVAGTVKATSFQGSGAELTGVSGTDTTKVAKTGDTMSGTLTLSATGTGLSVTHNAAVGGTLTAGGNVGIGTTSPGAKLDIRGSGNPLLIINHTGAEGHAALWLQQDGAPKAYLWWDQVTNRLSIGTPTTNPILSLLNNGNVGIGTTSPNTKLDVAGNLQILTGSNPIRFTAAWTGVPDGVANGAEISNDISSYRTLMIVGNRSAGLGRRVSVWDRLEVNGSLITTGSVAYGGLLNKLEIADNFTATVRCGDLLIGHSSRRGAPGRALVDWTTILGLNWDNDWPQGVRYFGQFSRFSSRVLKENIADVSGVEALETLDGLQPVKFNFKSDKHKILQIGFIAEDVPMAIATPDRQGVVTSHIVAILTKVVQEQQTLITQLANQVKQLEAVITPGSV